MVLNLIVCLYAILTVYGFKPKCFPKNRNVNSLIMRDYPKPSRLENTKNFIEAGQLSAKFSSLKGQGPSKKVAIIGGGLSGLGHMISLKS